MGPAVISILRPASRPALTGVSNTLSARASGFPHASVADFAAGLIARSGTQEADAAGNQRLHIGLSGLVGPHDPIHRRRKHDGRFRGEAQGGQQIVGPPGREPRNEIRARRRDQHHLRPARQLDMSHGGFRRIIPQVVAGRPARHGLKGHGGDESLRGGRHHHLHIRAAFDQSAHQVRTFIGGDAAGDTQQNSGLRRQWMPFSSLNRPMSLSNCLLIDRLLRCASPADSAPGYGYRCPRGRDPRRSDPA